MGTMWTQIAQLIDEDERCEEAAELEAFMARETQRPEFLRLSDDEQEVMRRNLRETHIRCSKQLAEEQRQQEENRRADMATVEPGSTYSQHEWARYRNRIEQFINNIERNTDGREVS